MRNPFYGVDFRIIGGAPYCLAPLNLYYIFDESVHEIKPSFSDHVDCIEKQMIGATEGSAVKFGLRAD